jgi:hypothetical protein
MPRERMLAMYAGIEPFDANTPMPPRPTAAPCASRPSGPQVTPPRLTPLHAAPDSPRVTMADLRLPADLVDTRAAALAQHARAAGAQHSMRLWREACQQAIVSLARAFSAVPDAAPCTEVHWQLAGDEYHVSIAFG